jgi:hypothetical protein
MQLAEKVGHVRDGITNSNEAWGKRLVDEDIEIPFSMLCHFFHNDRSNRDT